MTPASFAGLSTLALLALALVDRQDPLAWLIARLQYARAVGLCAGVCMRAAWYAGRIHWPVCVSEARQPGHGRRAGAV